MNTFLYVLIAALVVLGLVYAIVSIKKKGSASCGCQCSECMKSSNATEYAHTYTIRIDGMSCEHCKARVENAFNELEGCSAEVNLDEKIATLHSVKELTEAVMKQTVENLGFTYLSYTEA